MSDKMNFTIINEFDQRLLNEYYSILQSNTYNWHNFKIGDIVYASTDYSSEPIQDLKIIDIKKDSLTFEVIPTTNILYCLWCDEPTTHETKGYKIKCTECNSTNIMK